MKLNDYYPIGECKICKKTIYTPRIWTGRTKIGYTPPPKVKTCVCETRGG